MTARLARGEENIKTAMKPLRVTPSLGSGLACVLPLIIIYIFVKNLGSVVDWEEKIRLSCSSWYPSIGAQRHE